MIVLNGVATIWLLLLNIAAVAGIGFRGRRVLCVGMRISSVPALAVELLVAVSLLGFGEIGAGLGYLGFLMVMAVPIWLPPLVIRVGCERALQGPPAWHPESNK